MSKIALRALRHAFSVGSDFIFLRYSRLLDGRNISGEKETPRQESLLNIIGSGPISKPLLRDFPHVAPGWLKVRHHHQDDEHAKNKRDKRDE